MAEFFAQYGLFLLKTATIVIGLLVVIGFIVALGSRGGRHESGQIEVKRVNDRYDAMAETMEHMVLDKGALKAAIKVRKKQHKQERKVGKGKRAEAVRQRIYVLDFDGDIRATAVHELRRAISAILTVARDSDEVVLMLESGGGMVHAYGLAASQLQRIRDRGMALTVCVDKVAASGGYMMACVASHIVAAPFAIIGSIGVVAQLPNFHRLLKKYDIDYEMLTAGEYKRTLTLFGENTEKGRQKFLEEIEETHTLFKQFVAEHRPVVDVDRVATGEHWFGRQALEYKLVDELGTSDRFLMDRRDQVDIFEVHYIEKKSWYEKLGIVAEGSVRGALDRWIADLNEGRFR